MSGENILRFCSTPFEEPGRFRRIHSGERRPALALDIIAFGVNLMPKMCIASENPTISFSNSSFDQLILFFSLRT
jgi:hypothetical protein